MQRSRRHFLSGMTATATFAAARPIAGAVADDELAKKVVAEFELVPGKKALKLWAPESDGNPEWFASLNPEAALFCGSSFKVFVLAEYLRQIEGESGALKKGLAEELVLDESVFAPSSSVFNPPKLKGNVTAQTVLEAMIMHSDNTATDMALKRVKPERVREFISSIGLHNARIPTSTRTFFAYIFGYPEWHNASWSKIAESLADPKDPTEPRPIINNVETMVCSPHDFVSFYARALQGEFFKHTDTLETFRAILSRADAVAMSMPLGVSGFGKGGSIEFADNYVMSVAGGMWAAQRWVYFALIANAADKDLPQKYVQALKMIFAKVHEGLGRPS